MSDVVIAGLFFSMLISPCIVAACSSRGEKGVLATVPEISRADKLYRWMRD